MYRRPQPATIERPAPKRHKNKKPKGRNDRRIRYRWRSSVERAAFIAAYNKNPLNFLPGWAVHQLYGDDTLRSQAAMEKAGDIMLLDMMRRRGYRPMPGYSR